MFANPLLAIENVKAIIEMASFQLLDLKNAIYNIPIIKYTISNIPEIIFINDFAFIFSSVNIPELLMLFKHM